MSPKKKKGGSAKLNYSEDFDDDDVVAEIPMATVVVTRGDKKSGSSNFQRKSSFKESSTNNETESSDVNSYDFDNGSVDLHSIGSSKANKKKGILSPGNRWDPSSPSAPKYPKNVSAKEEEGERIGSKDVRNWPPKLKEQIVRSLKKPPNEDRANVFFDKHDWPIGLREAVNFYNSMLHLFYSLRYLLN